MRTNWTKNRTEVTSVGYGVIAGSLFAFIANRMNVIIIPFICIDLHGSPSFIGLFAATTGIGALLSNYANRPLLRFQNRLTRLLLFGIVELIAGSLIVLSAYSASTFVIALSIAGYLAGTAEVGISTSRQEMISQLGSAGQTDTFMSVEEAASKIAILSGGSLAGLTIGLLGVAQASIVPVILILIGILVYAFLLTGRNSALGRLGDADPPDDHGTKTRLLPLPDRASNPQIFFIILRFVSSFMWFSFSLGLALYGAQKTNGANGASLVSLATVLYGVGTIIGASVSVFVSGRISITRRIVLGWAGSSLMFVLLSMSIDSLIAVGLVSFIGGLFSPIGIAALNASIGSIEDIHQRSQHQMFLNWGLILSISIGSAFGGVLLPILGVQFSLLLSGLLVLIPVCTFCLLRAKRRSG